MPARPRALPGDVVLDLALGAVEPPEAERRVELAALEELSPQRTDVVAGGLVIRVRERLHGEPEQGLAGRLHDRGQGRRDLDEQALVVEDRPGVPGSSHQRMPGAIDPKR